MMNNIYVSCIWNKYVIDNCSFVLIIRLEGIQQGASPFY